jgi:transcriptional regulator with GAF, ATPase, and Fis domain
VEPATALQETVPRETVPAAIVAEAPATPRPAPGSEEERTLLLDVLANTGENIALTARALGVSRVTLYRMLRRHRIVPSRGFNARPGIAGEDLDGMAHQEHPEVPPAR